MNPEVSGDILERSRFLLQYDYLQDEAQMSVRGTETIFKCN